MSQNQNSLATAGLGAPLPHIPEWINNLESEIALAGKLAEELDGKLQPILRKQPLEKQAEDAMPEEYLAPHANTLRTLCRATNRVNSTLQSLLTRTEL